MLRKMTAMGMALGMLLPAAAVLAETATEQKAKQVRTEQQEMLQKGSQAAGEQERVQEHARTREEQQNREYSEYAKKQQTQKGPATGTAGDKLQDRDRTQDKDQLRGRDRDRDRLHDGSGSQNRKGGR